MWYLIVAGFYFAMAMFCLVLCTLSVRVLFELIKAGPAAADDAFRSGHTLTNWWNSTHPLDTATRTSLVGRHDKKFGVVLVEARSSVPYWLHR